MYSPNFSDPRVAKKCKSVLTWCLCTLSCTSAHSVHHDELARVFGARNNKLGNWLRAVLLAQVGQYTVGVQSFSYVLKQDGMDKVRSQVETREEQEEIKRETEKTSPLLHTSILQHMVYTSADPRIEKYSFLKEDDVHQLVSGEFKYAVKSNRYFNRLQNITRTMKREFWTDWGFAHHYDITASAPTLLVALSKLSESDIPTISAYLKDRSVLREHVASVTGMESSKAKSLVTALFNGARLACNRRCSQFRSMGMNRIAMDALKEDVHVSNMRREIKMMWAAISVNTSAKYSTSKAKWQLYYEHERRVLDIISSCLHEQQITHFTEHDGFFTKDVPNMKVILDEIQNQTGFNLEINKK